MGSARQSMTGSNERYDAVVIGSGIGGLTTAALLAKLEAWRVLVIERHYVVGGFTHTFKRPGGHEWDVGLHYVGGMYKRTQERGVFDFITNGNLQWKRMAEPFEKFHYPGLTFDLHGDPKRFTDDLVALFPAEQRAIRRYFKDVKKAALWMAANAIAGSYGAVTSAAIRLAARPWRTLALQPVAIYLEKQFRDPKLRTLLVSQAGTYGLAPSRAAFGIHATIVMHYLRGAYFPVGGSARIAETIVPVIEAAGGRVLTSTEARRVVMENGRAVGVETHNKHAGTQRFYAPVVVSNAGAWNTYARMLPKAIAGKYVERLRDLKTDSPSGVTVYLSFKESPATLGFQGENHWLFSDWDPERAFDGDSLLAGHPGAAYASFPSLKNPHAKTHTGEIIAFLDSRAFERWAGTDWRKRGGQYDGLKDAIAQALIKLMDQHHPGFAALVDRVEVSTPLSVEHFTAAPGGAFYGLPATPERFAQSWLATRTPVQNLYLTGADGFMFGIVGAMMGGVATVGAIRGGVGFVGVMAAIAQRAARDTSGSFSEPLSSAA